MGMKVSYICYPCRTCWTEIEGLIDVKGINLCVECAQKELNRLRNERIDNVNLGLSIGLTLRKMGECNVNTRPIN